MRAVILEVRGRSAAAMTENGGVEKVPALPGWETGLEVLLPAAPKKHPLARLYGGIAACAACLCMVWGIYAYLSPVLYVDVSINPAVHLSVNRFGKVVGAEGLNTDGQTLLLDVETGGSAGDCLTRVIGGAIQAGYLKTGGDVRLTVSSRDMGLAERYEQELAQTADALIAGSRAGASLHVQKLPEEDYRSLQSAIAQATEQDPGASLNEIYQSREWLGHGDLWLEEIEYKGRGRLEAEFTGELDPRGKTVFLLDAAGGQIPCTFLESAGDEWLLMAEGVSEGSLYTLCVEWQEGRLTGFFRANPGEESEWDGDEPALGESAEGPGSGEDGRDSDDGDDGDDGDDDDGDDGDDSDDDGDGKGRDVRPENRDDDDGDDDDDDDGGDWDDD